MARWTEVLGLLAEVVSHPELSRLIGSPRLSRDQLTDLVLKACGDRLDGEANNIVRLMGEAGRLALLPTVATLFEQLRAEAEGEMEAHVVSARPITQAQRRRISDALKARFGREVKLHCKTDRSLLGGAVIHAGDVVIDGSAQGQLARLTAALSR